MDLLTWLINYTMNDLKILSHGKVTDLSNGFSLGGKPFTICLIPKTATMELTTTVSCRLLCDSQCSELPVVLNDWAPVYIHTLAQNAIDLTAFDVYWGAHETI